MYKRIPSNSVFPLDHKSIHAERLLIGSSKNITQKPYDTATEFIQKKYSSLKQQQQQHKLYLHDYISCSIAKTLR